MPRPAREQAAGTPDPVPPWWLAACAAAAVVVVAAAASVSDLGNGGLMAGPLLAIPIALAGIGASSPYGILMLAAALVLATFARGSLLWIVAPVSVVAVTGLSALGVALNKPGKRERASVAPVEQKLADVTSVAEVVQRALLPPLPERVGPLELQAIYLAAAAQARVGGDLYEVAQTQFGIRLIVGDARGKGLDAVETAADVLGVFREVAHEVYTLAEAARRLDASLARRLSAGQAHSGSGEEFVTAVLAEIDPAAGSLTIYNCGHPPPLLLSSGKADSQQSRRSLNGRAAPTVTSVDVPSPAPPLRLTEARNPRHRCYPLATRLTELARASTNGIRPDLLECVQDDLLRHAGAPLDDDAALILVRGPARWGNPAPQPAQAAAPQLPDGPRRRPHAEGRSAIRRVQ